MKSMRFSCYLEGLNSLGPVVIEATSEGDAMLKFKEQAQLNGWSQQYEFSATLIDEEDEDEEYEEEDEE